MRFLVLLTMLFGLGCAPPAPLVGTWRYTLDMSLQTPTGPMTKKVTFDLDLASTGSPDLINWKLGGGCNVALPLVGKVASLSNLPPDAGGPPLCGLASGAVVLLVSETGTTVKSDDQLGVNSARFELLEDGHLGTSFDYKLYTDLRDSRVGPVFIVNTAAGTHGTKLK